MIWILLLASLPFIYALQKDTSLPRTVDQCYGQPIPVACDPGHMVKVNNAFYRQTENCRGGYRSNYCSKEEPSNPACVGNQTCVFTTPWIYLSADCGYSNNFLVSYQCVPSGIQHNICQKEEIRSTSGYIVSPHYPNKYPKSLHCHTKVRVRAGQRIRVYLLDLYLAYYNYDVDKQCVDALWIVDGQERTDYLCSGKQRGLIFTSQSNEITVFFTSEGHEYLNAKGFWLFFEGVAANKVQPRKVTYVKRPSSRSHATKAEEKLLSLLPIQVTPTDSSIIPPAPANSREIGEVTVDPVASLAKVPSRLQGQGTARVAGHPSGQIDQTRRATGPKWGGAPSTHKEGQMASLGNTKMKTQRHTQSKKTYNVYKQAEQPTSHSKEYKPRKEYSSREYHGRYRPHNDKSEEVIVRDKSKEVINQRRHIPTSVTAATTTQTARRYVSTRRPYIPTANTLHNSDKDSQIMQINMYNSVDEEDDELFNMLARSGEELIKGLKTNRDVKVRPVGKERTIAIVRDEGRVFKQAPLVTHKPVIIIKETPTKTHEVPVTTPTSTPIRQEETTVPTKPPPETPAVQTNTTAETILPWNSAYASEVKGIQEKEEAATGGIVGGAAGCILLVLAFVVLAVFWRRRHPHDKGGFPFSRKSSSYNDIIMAYAPSEAGSTGASNFGFDECPPPAALKEFPLDSCVANPNYVSPMQSWRNLLPIDEVPEIIYAQNKGGRPGLPPAKPNRSMLWMRSKSLDDLCAKIGSKVTKRRKKPPDPPIQQSQSLDCLKRAYENVILPANYHSMMTEDRPPPIMQRMASLPDLHPLDTYPPGPLSPYPPAPMSPFPSAPLSPTQFDLHLHAMQQHMHQQQLQQQQYLQQQQAVFQQQHQMHQMQHQQMQQNQMQQHQMQQNQTPQTLSASHLANPRPGYESLCLDGAAATNSAPAHSAALQPQDTTLLSRYETMALHKTPAADEVAL